MNVLDFVNNVHQKHIASNVFKIVIEKLLKELVSPFKDIIRTTPKWLKNVTSFCKTVISAQTPKTSQFAQNVCRISISIITHVLNVQILKDVKNAIMGDNVLNVKMDIFIIIKQMVVIYVQVFLHFVCNVMPINVYFAMETHSIFWFRIFWQIQHPPQIPRILLFLHLV